MLSDDILCDYFNVYSENYECGHESVQFFIINDGIETIKYKARCFPHSFIGTVCNMRISKEEYVIGTVMNA